MIFDDFGKNMRYLLPYMFHLHSFGKIAVLILMPTKYQQFFTKKATKNKPKLIFEQKKLR